MPWRAKLCFGGGTPRVGGRAHRATELRGPGRAQTEFGHEKAKNAALLDLGSTLVPSVGFGVPPKRTLTGAAQRRGSSTLAGRLREVRLGGTPRPTPGTGVLPGARRAAASREREICGLDAPPLRTRRAQADAGRRRSSAPEARPDRHRANPPTGSGCGEVSRRGRDGSSDSAGSNRAGSPRGFMGRSGWMEKATGPEWCCATHEPIQRSAETASRPKRGTERGGEQGVPGGCRDLLRFIFNSPAEGAGSLNSGEHARPAEEEEGGSGDWRAGEPCWRWRPAIANFPKYRIRSARHDSTRRRKFVLARRQNQHARRARSPDVASSTHRAPPSRRRGPRCAGGG